jgi:hypothetical protein
LATCHLFEQEHEDEPPLAVGRRDTQCPKGPYSIGNRRMGETQANQQWVRSEIMQGVFAEPEEGVL